MAKVIMIQGTASDSGKSITCAALCRILRQDGYRAAPFKSQNMALNSFITRSGLEMGRAQAMQAEAAGIAPDARMNPILLKPTSDVGSQVIVNGKSIGNMAAAEYFKYKKTLIPAVMEAYESLAREHDVIVIEGAGSPAEINLKSDDIVNMGLAKRTGAPVLLVGDIDRGGVFASLYGTVKLLDPDEQALVRGLIINKFRGDVEILRPGLKTIEDMLGIPVAGIVPFAHFDIDDEDSLASRLDSGDKTALIDIAVIRLPRISNFTDFNPLGRVPGVSLRYVRSVRELGAPDLIILPGSKSTISDLLWLRQSGLEAAVLKHASTGGAVFGVCGGYQMLGISVSDPDGVETGGKTSGLGLLPVHTVFRGDKTTVQVTGSFRQIGGVFAKLSGARFEGYEIHMGQSASTPYGAPNGKPLTDIMRSGETLIDGAHAPDGAWTENVAGSYVHGIFDSEEVARKLVTCLMQQKGIEGEAQAVDTAAYKELQYDLLADTVRGALDMELVYRIIEAGV